MIALVKVSGESRLHLLQLILHSTLYSILEVFSPDNFFIQHQDGQIIKLSKLLTDLSRYYIQCKQERSLDDLRVPSKNVSWACGSRLSGTRTTILVQSKDYQD